MAGNNYSEIITLIDVSSFHQTGHLMFKDDLIEHVKEAISFQVSRNAITNRKLIQLGLEPNLARVMWSYCFCDSTCGSHREPTSGRPMQRLTYERWDLFEEELNKKVKAYSAPRCAEIPATDRIKNVVAALHHLRLTGGFQLENAKEAPLTTASKSYQRDKIIFVFTLIPTVFSNLVHLATGVNNWKHSILTMGYKPNDIQICFVDIKFDNIATRGCNDMDAFGTLPCFWDELQVQNGEQRLNDINLSLKVSCVRKITMIHSLMELRFPWMYNISLRASFGFGMGMKRLRHYQKLPISPKEPRCLPLRKCWSESYSY